MANANLRIKVSTTGAREAKNSLSSITTAAKAVAASWAAIKAVQLGKTFVQTASEMETFNIRLRVVLGSAEKGSKVFQEMRKYAAQVPFTFKQVMESAAQLGGIMEDGSKEIKKWMPLIGDIAAATGLGIQQTTTQIIRMYSAGAASADLFRERGVLAMLGFKAGVKYTAEETRRMLMDAWTDPESKFRGATDELKSSWKGLTSMMSDAWTEFQLTIMESGLFDLLKENIGSITFLIKELNKELKGTKSMFADVLDFAKSASPLYHLIGWGKVAKESGAMQNTLDWLTGKSQKTKYISSSDKGESGGGSFIPTGNQGAESVQALKIEVDETQKSVDELFNSVLQEQMWDKFAEEMKPPISEFGNLNDALDKVSNTLKETGLEIQIRAVKDAVADTGAGLKETAESSNEFFDAIQQRAATWADRITDAFLNVASKGKEAFADMAESILRDIARIMIKEQIVMPLMASFGLVPPRALGGPVYAGSPYVVGERGPELFIPNSGGSIVPNGGGSNAVNVTVINNAGAEVQTQTKTNSNGTKEIQIMVDKAVKRSIQGGRYDRELGSAFGLKRAGR